jgi:2'-5' RNA ligase
MERLQLEISRGVRWVDPSGIHLTLKFLGNINGSLVEPVFQAMSRSAGGSQPFQLRLEGLGAFPDLRQPRVLWAGAEGDLPSLGHLQERVDREVAPVGFALEQRGFNPHLTLGRVRDSVAPPQRQGIGAIMTQTSLAPSEPWTVRELHLIQSNFTPNGTFYTSMGSVPLAAAAP